jgi:hypothetical protein
MKKLIPILVIIGLIGVINYAKADQPDSKEHKVTICHATSSATNPYVRIVVDEHAIKGHFDNNGTPLSGHEDDILLQGEQDCPTPTPIPDPDPTPTPDPDPTPTPDPDPNPTPTPTPGPSGGSSGHRSSGSKPQPTPFAGLQMQLTVPEQAVLADNVPDTLPRTGQSPAALLSLLIVPAGFVLKKLIFN